MASATAFLCFIKWTCPSSSRRRPLHPCALLVSVTLFYYLINGIVPPSLARSHCQCESLRVERDSVGISRYVERQDARLLSPLDVKFTWFNPCKSKVGNNLLCHAELLGAGAGMWTLILPRLQPIVCVESVSGSRISISIRGSGMRGRLSWIAC
jgi:hypothetical protein